MENNVDIEAKTDLNIFIISNDYNEKDFQIKDEKCDLMKNWKIYKGKNEELESIFKKYKDILNDYKKKDEKNEKKIMNDLFILQVNNSKDKLIIQLLKYLDELIDGSETYLIPFIIFLVNEDSPEDIMINHLEKNGENEEENDKENNEENEDDDEIDFSKFEQKKIWTFPFKMNEITKAEFKKRLFKICSYYHELGNLFYYNNKDPYNLSDIRIFESHINILLTGRSGAGKSTFINEFLGDYYAREGGSSLSTSVKFTRYYVPNIPIILIDSPGFENEETKNNVIKKLKDMKDSLLKNNEQIHLILYFIDGSSENKFLEFEKEVLEYLISNPVPILFIVSHCQNNPKSKNKKVKNNYKTDFDKIKNALMKILDEKNFNTLINKNSKIDNKEKITEISIKGTNCLNLIENGLNEITKEYKDKDSNKNLNDIENIKNIILVNFKKKEVSEYIIPPFGIETIFSNIYYFLSDASLQLKKILEFAEVLNENKELDKKDKEKQLEIMLKKNLFFHNFTSLDEREKNMEKKARSVIRYQTFYAGTTGFFPIVDIASHYYIKKSLNNQIADIYGFNIEKDSNSDKKKEYSDIVNTNKDNVDTKIKKKKAEEEINKKTQSSLSNTGKTALGIVAGESGQYFLDTAVSGASSLVGYGLRFATSLALLGGQIVLGMGYGGYKMHSNGEEILKIYKSKYYEKKYESIISYITSFIKAINYFQIISDGFKELNDEKGEIKRKENKFDITIILEKYKKEIDLYDNETKKDDAQNNFGFEIIENYIK